MRFRSLVTILIMMFVLSACGENTSISNQNSQQGSTSTETTTPSPSPSPSSNAGENNQNFSKETNPIVTIEMSNGKTMKIELYPEVAPNTVNNFITLINQGFYDGLIFHRVIPEFMIQGGDPTGSGAGGPGYSIKGEFSENGIENNLKHTRGVISMARSNDMDSAGSQFFIVQAESVPHLDGLYATFGKVTEGLDVVDEIVNQERDSMDLPLNPLSMTKVTVDTKGIEYPEPEKI